jgi:hypothetical protein
MKSIEGSAWISFASSRIRRTPGDFVLRGMIVMLTRRTSTTFIGVAVVPFRT